MPSKAAEKALNAVLVATGRPFPKTHDLERLRALIGDIPSGFPQLDIHGATLSEYATEVLSEPSTARPIDEDEARHACGLAHEVVAQCATAARAPHPGLQLLRCGVPPGTAAGFYSLRPTGGRMLTSPAVTRTRVLSARRTHSAPA